MEQEIKDIIAKNLPAHVGDALQTRLKEIEKLEEENEKLSTRNKAQAIKIKELDEEIKDIRWRTENKQQLEMREKELDKREASIELETLKYQLASEKEKTEFSKDVALGLVRNTTYRRSLFDNTTEPAGTDQYGGQQYANKTQNSTETKTEE